MSSVLGHASRISSGEGRINYINGYVKSKASQSQLHLKKRKVTLDDTDIQRVCEEEKKV